MSDVAAELALGVLTGRERAMAVAHLNECDACREDVRQLMETGEQLLELLPPAEPPAGFESRVLERLGLPAPAPGTAEPRVLGRPEDGPGHPGPAGAGPRPGTDRPASGHPGTGRPAGGRPGAGPARPGRKHRVRRALVATAMVVAVVAAGLGGWRIGTGASPSASFAAAPITSSTLLSATQQDVGDVFLYSGDERWMYMSVDLGFGNGLVKCQVVGTDGRVTTVGTFRLADGYGGWGTPAPANTGALDGAQLVSANGTVLASASFSNW
ncbi:MAG TPA: hypothetical protein VIZ43_30280 [Trebonia sp.]